jgi:cytochrome d ubiquinol oxidase subunit II
MMVLWLLILRGIAIEFRGHIDSAVWRPVWDAVFTGASALLAIFFGAALGNVVRGVAFDDAGEFFSPLWTSFGVRGDPGILDWYTVSVGILAYFTLTHHGALWVVYKTGDPIRARGHRIAGIAWWAVAGWTAMVTWMSWAIQPQIAANLSVYPLGWAFPALALAGLGASFWFRRQEQDARAFAASCVFIAGMLGSAAFGVYPYVLPSNGDPASGLTIQEAAAPGNGLRIGLMWWIPGMLLALGYTVYTHVQFAGKVGAEEGY